MSWKWTPETTASQPSCYSASPSSNLYRFSLIFFLFVSLSLGKTSLRHGCRRCLTFLATVHVGKAGVHRGAGRHCSLSRNKHFDYYCCCFLTWISTKVFTLRLFKWEKKKNLLGEPECSCSWLHYSVKQQSMQITHAASSLSFSFTWKFFFIVLAPSCGLVSSELGSEDWVAGGKNLNISSVFRAEFKVVVVFHSLMLGWLRWTWLSLLPQSENTIMTLLPKRFILAPLEAAGGERKKKRLIWCIHRRRNGPQSRWLAARWKINRLSKCQTTSHTVLWSACSISTKWLIMGRAGYILYILYENS